MPLATRLIPIVDHRTARRSPPFRFPSAFAAWTALAAVVAAVGCGPAAAPAPQPSPSPAPIAPPTAAVMQTCPTDADGPSIVVGAVVDARRALASNPATPLPPACVLTAFARLGVFIPDSLVAQGIDLASALAARGGSARDLRESQVLLYARAHRYADASRAWDALATAEPQPAMDLARAAIVAANQRRDTATLIRLLGRTAPRPDAPPFLRAELNVLRQVGALHAAINEARGLVRQNPKYLGGYPSLVGNFGTLGVADSVVAYLRRALAQGATRASLMTAVDPFVNTMLRHAALYGAAGDWDAAIAAAFRVDSTLSSPSTKFLVASLIAQGSQPRIDEIGFQVNGASYGARSLGSGAPAAGPADRAVGCRAIAPVLASLAVGESRLRAGGDRFGGGGASQVGAAISAERSTLARLQDVCARS